MYEPIYIERTPQSNTQNMDETHLFFICVLSLFSLIYLFKLVIHKKTKNLPPSPPSLPIIGHLHLINGPIHRVLQHLASKYGPIMSLRFGTRQVLVITSPSAAQECFTTNDIALANIPLLLTGKYLSYNCTSVGSAPYGQLWRDLRRIMTLELFSTTRLKHYMGVRQDEVRSLIKDLLKDSFKDFSIFEMRSRIQGMSFNIIMNIIADKGLYGTKVEDVKEASEFKKVIRDIFEVSGTSNPSDFIPFLRWIDYQGLEKKLLKLQKKSDRFIQNLIEKYKSKRSGLKGNAMKFIDAMLSLQESEPEYYTDDVIKSNILILLLAGTDTSSVTIEWALSLLLNHPNVLKKARAQIDEFVGNKRLVQETDLPNLPYIQCIINETLRLFPAIPLLIPHEPSEDCTIGGFDVARGTMVLVNAWAIHRDPMAWDDPLNFKPERFEKVINKGYQFIPFGMGRRQCPGSGLANRVIWLVLASLIQCFEWERVGEELVGLLEGKGLTMPKNEPLTARFKARQAMCDVLMKVSELVS
ncbi:putative isoflavone 2'-hydroxylase [Helianthus annuus]|nr:putative isoflavone 2'-hydroxylase [Helianthus annuus]